MKLEIIKQEKNPFLQREELTIEITADSAPSTSEVIAKLGKDEALTVIKKINTNFGQHKFLTEAVIYDNIEARKNIETIPQKVRKKMAADKKAEEDSAKKKAQEEAKAVKEAEEAAKAEAETPKEEKVEEVKEEEKAE
jgi:ribosomal protein S24E